MNENFYYLSYVCHGKWGTKYGGMCVDCHPLLWVTNVNAVEPADVHTTVISWNRLEKKDYDAYANRF